MAAAGCMAVAAQVRAQIVAGWHLKPRAGGMGAMLDNAFRKIATSVTLSAAYNM